MALLGTAFSFSNNISMYFYRGCNFGHVLWNGGEHKVIVNHATFFKDLDATLYLSFVSLGMCNMLLVSCVINFSNIYIQCTINFLILDC